MKTIKLLCFIPLMLFSCEKNMLEENDDKNKEVLSQITESPVKLPMETVDLDKSAAANVAKIFIGQNGTRNSNDKAIENIVAIYDDDNIPVIYAINFKEGGFVMVSSTTKYFPIVGYSETGKFMDINNDNGESIILGKIIEEIKLAKEDKYDFECAMLWNKYKKGDIPLMQNDSRQSDTTRASDDYWDVFDKWYYSNMSSNTRIMKLVNCQDILPANIYQKFKNAVEFEDLWEGTEYNWKETVYVVEKDLSQRILVGPYLQSTWEQDRYNLDTNLPLGCVTVATGQLMRYFQYPSTFSWTDMPLTYPSQTTKDFLSRLRGELRVDGKGGAKIGDAERVFKNYGYSVTKKSHDLSATLLELKSNKRPIYTGGFKGIFEDGHAWIMDGVDQYYTRYEYTLYKLNDRYYPDFEYMAVEGIDPYVYHLDGYVLIHMNLGWGSAYNTWYNDSNVEFEKKDGSKYNYNYNRQDLFIIPNK